MRSKTCCECLLFYCVGQLGICSLHFHKRLLYIYFGWFYFYIRSFYIYKVSSYIHNYSIYIQKVSMNYHKRCIV